jgi:CMP-N,N'-diacetyllegionaminic acid synthase
VINGRSVLAVVPARGGSKGVPLKNVHPLRGKPLIVHTADLVRRSDWIDRAVVSTDHPAIAKVAVDAGLEAPFLRPEELSGDRVGDLEVLVHALNEMERLAAIRFDVVLMLQPTSPLRTAEDVRRTAALLVDEGWDAAWTVSPTPLKYHPLKQLQLDESGRLTLADARGRNVVARQQLMPVYHRNGAAYAFSRRCLLELSTILPERCGGIVLEGAFVSIDTVGDFVEVENIMKQRESR